MGFKFKLSDSELALFDGYAREYTNITGTEIDLYSLSVERSVIDALYDEPIQRKYVGPFRLTAYMAYPESDPEPREEGVRTQWDATAWISRKELEAVRSPRPDEGDVLRAWSLPIHNQQAVNDLPVPRAGLYFDVINVNNDGHLFDTPSFVGFRLVLRRRSEFTPERKITRD